MTTIRILLSLIFAGWLMPSYGQKCAEPIIKYLYATQDPCGYHGALNFDLIGKTALEKADDFVDIWKSEILSGEI